jgi:hypothetical protein
MGNFVHHSTGSLIAGTAAGAGVWYGLHTTPIDSVAIGMVCAISGLIPDIDSPYSIPTEFVLSMVSAFTPVIVYMHYSTLINTPSLMIISIAVMFFLSRFILRFVLKHITVHRGMIHSIPSALIWGTLIFLSFKNTPDLLRNLFAASATLGFVVHLIIDEMFSLVDISGGTYLPKKSSGTALKFFSTSPFANFLCYGALIFLMYFVFKDARWLM